MKESGQNKKKDRAKNTQNVLEDAIGTYPDKARKEKPEESASTVKEKNNKKNTSLRLEKHVLKALKIKAIEQDTSVQKLIENLILEYLDKN